MKRLPTTVELYNMPVQNSNKTLRVTYTYSTDPVTKQPAVDISLIQSPKDGIFQQLPERDSEPILPLIKEMLCNYEIKVEEAYWTRVYDSNG